MQINLETADQHAIQSYSESGVKINNVTYENSLIVGKQSLITPWLIRTIQELDVSNLDDLLKFNPEIIIIGHNQLGAWAPMAVIQHLSKLRIGIECMSIGAASRTFNVLLSEQRTVVMGLIL